MAFPGGQKLKLLAVAYDLEWGRVPDAENEGAIRIHDAIEKYAEHARDRVFKDPRPNLTQLLAADKSSRKDWEYEVSRGEQPEEVIRKTIINDRIWFQEISHGDYFEETGQAPPMKRKATNSSSPAGGQKYAQQDNIGSKSTGKLWKGSAQSAKGFAKGGNKTGKVKGSCYAHNEYQCQTGMCPQGYNHVCQVCGSPDHRKDFHRG